MAQVVLAVRHALSRPTLVVRAAARASSRGGLGVRTLPLAFRPRRPGMGVRWQTTSTTAAAATGAGRRGLRVPGAIAVLAGVGAGAAVGALWFGVDLEDVRVLFRDPSSKAREDAALLGEGEEAVFISKKFVHPYNEYAWYTRLWISGKRLLFLAATFAPLVWATVFAKLWPYNAEYREHWCEVMLACFERAGCTYQKFAQWISMRPDVFPDDIIRTTQKLRDSAPEHEWAHTEAEFRNAFGKEIDEVFESFGRDPIASGTVGQVYRGRLREEYAFSNGERDVAVKVRHPAVMAETFVDVHFLAAISPYFHLIIASPLEGTISTPFRMDFFEYRLQQQLDFHYEAYNLARFARSFRREDLREERTIRFPRVHPRLLSDAILVESWVPGRNMSQMFKDDKEYVAQESMRHHLAMAVFDMTIKMFLRDNYVHGDLHAGNLMVVPQSCDLTVIDAGMATTLPKDLFDKFGGFLKMLVRLDPEGMAAFLLHFHDIEHFPTQPKIERVVEQVSRALDEERKLKPADRENPHLADVLGAIFHALSRSGVVLRGDIAATMMTMTMAEGLVRFLDPEFDFISSSLPYFVRYRGWESSQNVLDEIYVNPVRSKGVIVHDAAAKPGELVEHAAAGAAAQPAPAP